MPAGNIGRRRGSDANTELRARTGGTDEPLLGATVNPALGAYYPSRSADTCAPAADERQSLGVIGSPVWCTPIWLIRSGRVPGRRPSASYGRGRAKAPAR